MKHRKAILSHTAVFIVGAALAVVGFRSNSSQPQPGSDDDAGLSTGRRPGAPAGLGESRGLLRSSAQRERGAAGNSAGRPEGPTTERLTSIVRMGDPLERQLALMDLLDRLGPGEFAAVAEQFRQMDHYSGSGGEFDLILRSWAKANPLEALEYTTKQLKSGSASAEVLAAWAGKDAAAAESWALANHTGDGPNPYLAAVIRGVAAYDIGHATRLLESLPPGGEQRDGVDSITRALLVQGGDTAMNFPSTIQDPKLRAGFISAIAKRLTAKDPAQAGAWLASMSDANDQNQGARRVAQALAQQDPQAAADWLRKLQPAARAEAARGVIPKMSEGDITGTAQWVTTLAGIPNYDRVVEEFVWSCDYRAPEQSAAWIGGIADPRQQARLYHQMLGEWAKRDAGAVKTWVADNQVPESVARRFNR